MSLFDFVWPYVGRMPPDASLEADLETIASASWKTEPDAILEEVRRLRDIETSRKNSAETKSQIYLAALLTLIPVLISLADHDTFEGVLSFSNWYQTLGYICFILGISYGIGAFIASFRALTVRAFHRIDVNEISESSKSKSPVESLGKGILRSVRRDRNNINLKISFVIVAHGLVFRMAFLLLLALSLITFVPVVEPLIKLILGAIHS
jgi:hypothetical protein